MSAETNSDATSGSSPVLSGQNPAVQTPGFSAKFSWVAVAALWGRGRRWLKRSTPAASAVWSRKPRPAALPAVKSEIVTLKNPASSHIAGRKMRLVRAGLCGLLVMLISVCGGALLLGLKEPAKKPGESDENAVIVPPLGLQALAAPPALQVPPQPPISAPAPVPVPGLPAPIPLADSAPGAARFDPAVVQIPLNGPGKVEPAGLGTPVTGVERGAWLTGIIEDDARSPLGTVSP